MPAPYTARQQNVQLIVTMFHISGEFLNADLEDNDEDGEDDLEEALAEFEVCRFSLFFVFWLCFCCCVLLAVASES